MKGRQDQWIQRPCSHTHNKIDVAYIGQRMAQNMSVFVMGLSKRTAWLFLQQSEFDLPHAVYVRRVGSVAQPRTEAFLRRLSIDIVCAEEKAETQWGVKRIRHKGYECNASLFKCANNFELILLTVWVSSFKKMLSSHQGRLQQSNKPCCFTAKDTSSCQEILFYGGCMSIVSHVPINSRGCSNQNDLVRWLYSFRNPL